MINGKSIFSWNVPSVGKGDPTLFVKFLIDNNFEGVCLKTGDGPLVQKISKLSPWPTWGENVRPELVEAIKAAKLKVFLWHFVYGNDVIGELNVAISQCSRFSPDGFIWDVENQFDGKTNNAGNSRYLSSGLRRAFPDLKQALCWWALPLSPSGIEWHPLKVGRAFMEVVDVGMPMMYWQEKGPEAAILYLHRSMEIWKNFWTKPIIPIGRAFTGGGGYGDSFGISAFAEEVMLLRKANKESIPGLSWWSADHAIKEATWVSALRNTQKFSIADPFVLTAEEKLRRLVEHSSHREIFPELYE